MSGALKCWTLDLLCSIPGCCSFIPICIYYTHWRDRKTSYIFFSFNPPPLPHRFGVFFAAKYETSTGILALQTLLVKLYYRCVGGEWMTVKRYATICIYGVFWFKLTCIYKIVHVVEHCVLHVRFLKLPGWWCWKMMQVDTQIFCPNY